MIKKAYQQPAMEVIETVMDRQILAGSVNSVTTTGLDDDNLELNSGSGSIWDAL
mgnify:CR=1 FL=1